MALPKGKSNSGIKNLKHFPKGKSGYHFIPINKICLNCNIPYITKVEHSKFCSQKCRDKFRPDRKGKGIRRPAGSPYKAELTCKFCENIFYVKKYQIDQAIFCSRKCHGLYMTCNGELNYIIKAFVYYEPICNRCGIEDEHVLCVHHIDHDRKNNNIKNLEIVCANCHHKHHYGSGEYRKEKIRIIKEFIRKNPLWREKNANFKR